MGRFVEYYEVKTADGYEYYFMPVDVDAKNKENFDSRSHRIWKFDTKRSELTELKNIRKDKPQLNRADFLKIQLTAKPAPYSEYYLRMQEIKDLISRNEHKISSNLGEV